MRRDKCPFGEGKSFCSNCPIHCYKSDMREKIRQVMRYSGPRMLLYHPVVAMSHVVQTIRHNKRIKKQNTKEERKDEKKS